ncbi:hypothetical protein [Echinicola vietnamensis]|uniref:Beta-galactosidase trimerisation domain-containing protein n=1 Tax=Echinicola vietnamensis (strain DSM 17526 / LMG 23754 / KMM 6221) TaxID=926556 RepID=L0FUI6_ECHVK|nr:hypothetical protein [Echinicola vietnamensis]AGA76688.1 hypothetical protein Echvi_0400 [Echinicola vietnamensis DSM 17526]
MFKSKILVLISLLLVLEGCSGISNKTPGQDPRPLVETSLKGKPFHNITLEASLKPFKQNDEAYFKKVASEMFTQWHSLLRHADTVSVMLWTADGSEILDYSGDLNQPLEWSKYIGNPNTEHEVGSGPKELSLHERAYLYMENPPDFTYKDLKLIVNTLKETGEAITGKPVRIGATFDPGPEFAKSPFKYEKHPEILEGSAMGHKSFVFSYATLNADDAAYAGFPNGIPGGTPFGTFFGRQSQHFLSDLDFDYIWFSNGFGFGMEPWASTGTIFTGTGFNADKLEDTRKKIIDFWSLFRKECSGFRIETRGTNLSTGVDLAKDGVDLKAIYEGDFNILPPPNSPWAALDGDFGLELVGYLSRMAELPDDRYIFRYYTHDPWWLNSPWLDRYGREPHDIYLPMSVARINGKGEVALPTHLNFLTIDDSYGNMPTQVPDEVIPHILKARYDAPTAPGPLVWVYPFEEYHQWARMQPDRLSEIYYGDWFIRQAINNGLPLNTVISTGNFKSALQNQPDLFDESVLMTIVPDAGSEYEKQLMEFVKSGGKVIIYGPSDRAGEEFLSLVNLRNDDPLEGEFSITGNYENDILKKKYPKTIRHDALFSGGGLRSQVKDRKDPYTRVLVKMSQGNHSRDALWVRQHPGWKDGKVIYLRGTNSSHFEGERLLEPDDPAKYFTGPSYLRYALKECGLEYAVDKRDPAVKSPVLSISRSNNGFFFAGYVPNTTVDHRFKFGQGAPVLLGYDTELQDGFATYSFPTAWNRECRVFVEQQNGIVSCKEMHSGELGITRRLQVSGLENATVRIYPDEGISEDEINFYLNSGYPWKTGKISSKKGEKEFGNSYVVEGVTGELVVSW